MNKYALKLLETAYKNYRQSGIARADVRGSNAEEIAYYFNAAEFLVEQGFITPLSNNIGYDSIDLFNSVIRYELTDLGLQYASSKWED